MTQEHETTSGPGPFRPACELDRDVQDLLATVDAETVPDPVVGRDAILRPERGRPVSEVKRSPR